MVGGEQPQLTDPHGDAGLRWLLDHRKLLGLADSVLACLLGVCTDTLLGWTSYVVWFFRSMHGIHLANGWRKLISLVNESVGAAAIFGGFYVKL